MRYKKTLAFILSCTFLVGLTTTISSCDRSQNELIDYVHTSEDVRLKIDYKDDNGNNRDFFKDGITEVKSLGNTSSEDNPYTVIDGDTVHFRTLEGNDLIKIRFYGIDTPESTGTVEPYGEKAKNFTKEKIETAKTIVITSTNISTYEPPSTDSTGTRYLGMVWISEEENCPYDELSLLNLWIVQDGLSYVKNLDEAPEFSETFYAAESQARDNELNLFSNEPDDLFNYGDYVMTDLLAIKEEIVNSLENGTENSFNNKNVRVRGTVAGYANNMLYLQTYFETESEDGTSATIEYAGINIFTGMSPIPSKYTKVNTYLELSAVAKDNENFGFQLTSVYSFPQLSSSNDENDTKILYKADDIPEEYKVHTFEMTASELGEANYDVMFSPVTVTEELTITGGYDSSGIPVEATLYCQTANGQRTDFSVYVPFIYTPDPNNPIDTYQGYEDFVGHTIRVTGIYSFHKSASGNITWQIIPRSNEDIVLVK